VKKLLILRSALVGLAVALSACGPAQPDLGATPTLNRGAVNTAVVATQTESAQLTALARQELPLVTPAGVMPPAGPTATRLAGGTLAAGTGAAGTPGATLTTTPMPTPTGLPFSTRGDKASYVSDVTVADGSRLEGGKQFTKTWRLINSGDTTWTPEFSLVFVSGSQMGGPASVPVPVEVEPGQTVDLSVQLTAPTESGTHRGYWMLRNSHGEYFGIGSDADQAVWVEIIVGPGVGTPGTIITMLEAAAKVTRGRGGCPQLYQLYFYVTLNQPTKIKFQWEGYSDDFGGKMAPFAVHEVDMTETGSFGIGPETFNLTVSAHGELRVHILEPEDMISNPVRFSAGCDDE
jgi:hypothetical protein